MLVYLFSSIREVLDVKLFVEIGSDQKEVDAGPKPDEGVRDTNNHHLLILVFAPFRAVLPPNITHNRRWWSEPTGLIY